MWRRDNIVFKYPKLLSKLTIFELTRSVKYPVPRYSLINSSVWALHENKSLLEGQFAIVLQQISINCCPYSYSGKCQLSEVDHWWLHCLCVTDWWHPPRSGDMCSNIFKCHHPGDERVRDHKYHHWSHGARIFLTLSPRVSSWACSHWLSARPGLRWVKPILSSARARRGGTTNYKARLGHGPRSRLDTSSMAHSLSTLKHLF